MLNSHQEAQAEWPEMETVMTAIHFREQPGEILEVMADSAMVIIETGRRLPLARFWLGGWAFHQPARQKWSAV
jgi:hypothetical protein